MFYYWFHWQTVAKPTVSYLALNELTQNIWYAWSRTPKRKIFLEIA